MEIAGSHRLPMARNRVWTLLNDPEVLARATPGVQSLEPAGEGRYTAAIDVGVGPVRGRFNGTIEVCDPVEPEALTLKVEAQGSPGAVRAEGRLRLEADGDEATTVHYDGQAQVTGTLAAVGSRLVASVAKMQVGQFFERLSREA